MLRRARLEPSHFFIGLDANAENLAAASRRASCKPQRGGACNVLYVQAAAEALPAELDGLADDLSVLLPWGSLLAAVAVPDVGVLAEIARACKPGAKLRVVFGQDSLTEEHVRSLPARYEEAGFAVAARPLSNRELAELGTSWAGRLAHGRARRFWELHGQRR